MNNEHYDFDKLLIHNLENMIRTVLFETGTVNEDHISIATEIMISGIKKGAIDQSKATGINPDMIISQAIELIKAGRVEKATEEKNNSHRLIH